MLLKGTKPERPGLRNKIFHWFPAEPLGTVGNETSLHSRVKEGRLREAGEKVIHE
jgi:hypothetical protein